MHPRQRWRWILATAGGALLLAVVLGFLSYRGGIWLMVALVAGAVVSVLLAELAERHHHHEPGRAEPLRPGRLRSEGNVTVLDVYAKRVD